MTVRTKKNISLHGIKLCTFAPMQDTNYSLEQILANLNIEALNEIILRKQFYMSAYPSGSRGLSAKEIVISSNLIADSYIQPLRCAENLYR